MIAPTSAKLTKGLAKKYAFEHARRNIKYGNASLNRLTLPTLKKVVEYCDAHSNELVASLALTILFTGRTVADIVCEDVSFSLTPSGLGRLGLTWNLRFGRPESALLVTFGKEEFETDPYVLIPPTLAASIDAVRQQRKSNQHWEKSVDEFLSGFRGPGEQLVTRIRLQKVIDYEHNTVGMTRYERDYIANRPIDDNMQNFYAAFSVDRLHKGLLRFGRLFLLPEYLNGYEFETEAHEVLFGSNRKLSAAGVQDIFKLLTTAIERALNNGALRHVINAYATYTIQVLSVATLHRPIKRPFGTINDFYGDFSHVEIEDKGPESFRVVPLCKFARNSIREYCKVLEAAKVRFRFQQPNEYACICEMLEGKSALFRRLTTNSFLADFSASTEDAEDPFLLRSNWHRHTISSELIRRGIDRDLLSAFMGHRQKFDTPLSDFSAFNLSDLQQVSRAIDALFDLYKVRTISGLYKQI